MTNKIVKTEIGDPTKITRKEALRKGGKYAALTAASLLVVLSPKESQAQSGVPSSPPIWPGGL
ncbi:MAG: hypothetical protein R2757_07230 [Draconibacterium sp.]